ncbi:MAG: helix-turn-helix domain-containing protein [Eubacteriales bacterium]
MKSLKELRNEKKLTQQQVAELVGISRRSYIAYENDKNKIDTIKYKYIEEKLLQINPIDESNGILEIDDIQEKCHKIFEKYEVNFCYLFGSYAKASASENSDVDLLISTDVKGLLYYGLVEEIRSELHKKVDVLQVSQLRDNLELIQEILKDGIKIYG